jgi:hypothetical protein
MKQYINEAKRFQKLANIKEAPNATMNNIAMQHSNPPPNTPPGATVGTTVNTTDEKSFQTALENDPAIKNKLNNITSIDELDGIFKLILSKVSFKDISKSNIINALSKALKELEPTSSTITTKKK